MENASENKNTVPLNKTSKHICLGILAHVDAGKTTLSEGMLYLSGRIRSMGPEHHAQPNLEKNDHDREP